MIIMQNRLVFVIIISVCLNNIPITVQNEVDEILDAFNLPSGYFYSNYENHTSAVICGVHLDFNIPTGIAYYHLENGSNRSFDGSLCTHVVLKRLTLDPNSGDVIQDENYKMMGIVGRKIGDANPHLKILAEIWMDDGDGNTYQSRYNLMRRLILYPENEKHDKIAKSLKDAILSLNLSGVHFAIEFAFAIKHPGDSGIYYKLSRVLKQEFVKDNLLLSMEIKGFTRKFNDNIHLEDDSYKNLANIGRLFDFVVVCGFDYYPERRAKSIHHNSPLHQSDGNSNFPYSIEYTLTYLIFTKWIPPNKLILKIAFFGKTDIINSSTIAEKFPEKSETSLSSPITKSTSSMTYFEICSSAMNKNESWKIYWDHKAKVPFMRSENHWISFDNPKSVYEKVIFAQSLGIRGIMTHDNWMDDISGICSKITNPLLKTINYALAERETEHGSTLCSTYESEKIRNPGAYNEERQNPLATIIPYISTAKWTEEIEINCVVNKGFAVPNTTWAKVNRIHWPHHSVPLHFDDNIYQTVDFEQNLCLPYNTTTTTLTIKSINVDVAGEYVCYYPVGTGEISEYYLIECEGVCEVQWRWILLGCLLAITFVTFVIIYAVYFQRRKRSERISESERFSLNDVNTQDNI